MNNDRDRLRQEYYVDRIDERDRAGGDRVDARYFVLDYVHDPFAIAALEAYAAACSDDLPNLSQEIGTLIGGLRKTEERRPM